MDKFSGLFVKANGEWSLHGKLDADVDGKIAILKQMTDNGGKFGKDKKADAAIVLHSVKGVIKNRTFA
jgi:hypothetical protein